ncbi:uncharacterized protein A1O9_10603 [Exophiala aquamarina CBS 119918]|uniref:2-oxoadipate dioxygenase/decarboxylase n=1 Tax=Exophiala aquamarina CBS 119918 TaxID=1182545 RepID=A0A072PC50_9EURO|nr:uncharacterized protein A1O9_10603 [Exophiala aquamarina CBS 119918]KEF53155.1 hypothetical protein A1O9_10603 [Exophiala aquamarina CBS 119918]
MYKAEVPLYGTLVDIVRSVDGSILAEQGKGAGSLPTRHELERHGAIRLGTQYELRTIKRLFAILGMYPVGYYDLGVLGFPLHATTFRPITERSLQKNPFRVFTTLLRKERLTREICDMVELMLEQRKLFTRRLVEIIDHVEAGRAMTAQDADDLLSEALKIFKWHSRSHFSMEEYLVMKQIHPIVADISCFPSAHINHLTPRTLNIDFVQKEMVRLGLPAKERIEGPPPRKCPILLRQTSFKALEEYILFDRADSNGIHNKGTHTARFGEVEQRGAAVTPHFPDSWAELREQGLVFFQYRPTSAGLRFAKKSKVTLSQGQHAGIEWLISRGLIECEPITYEDFLPFSAAGIFKSNVTEDPAEEDIRPETSLQGPDMENSNNSDLKELESSLGCKVYDVFLLYEAMQCKSIQDCEEALGLKDIVLS